MIEMKDSREKLLAEKFHLVSQTQVAVRDNEKLTDSNVALEGRVNDLKLENERLIEEVEAAHRATQLAEGRFNDIKSENERLRGEMEAPHNVTQPAEGKVTNLKSDIKGLRGEVEAVHNATQLAEGRVTDLKSDNERLRGEVEAAHNTTQLAEGKVANLKSDIEGLRAEVEATHNATQLAEGRVTNLKSDIEGLRGEVEAAHNAKQLAEGRVNDLKSDNERLRGEVEAAHNARQLAEKKVVDKLRETRDQGSTIKELATQCGNVMGHQNHSQKIKYMVKLKNDNVDLKSKVTKLETELAIARRKPARPITARSNDGGAQNKENAVPLSSSTASRKNTTAKATLKPDGKSATAAAANSQARSASGVGSRRAITKK